MSFVCGISGAVPQFPVVTPAGMVYEKKLLSAVLSTNGGRCPATDAPLAVNDCIMLQSSKTPASAPASTSGSNFTGVLSTLQGEWDALMVETYNLRLALDETRAELSQALYQNDAAVRVIARLTMERDQARASLAGGAGAAAAAAAASDAAPMETDEAATGVPKTAVEAMVATWSTLSGDRKKKSTAGAEHVPAEKLKEFAESSKKALHKASGKTGICALAASSDSSIIASGGNDHQMIVFDRASASVVATKATGSKSTVSLSFGTDGASTVVSGNADGTVKVFQGAEYKEISSMQLDNAVVDVSVQPTNMYYFATSAGGTVSFCDLASSEVLATFTDDVAYTSGALHPDGLIYAAGSAAAIKLWDVKSSTLAASLPVANGSTCIAFSENGYHFASGDSEGVVSVFDLRKQKIIGTVKGDGAITGVSFDGAGKYLAHTSAKGGAVHAVKAWDSALFTIEAKKKPHAGVVWGQDAKWLAAGCEDRNLTFYGE
jgi:pre-mRNA-processing factor 19